eukprot:1965118-Amphidinium_carterae.1
MKIPNPRQQPATTTRNASVHLPYSTVTTASTILMREPANLLQPLCIVDVSVSGRDFPWRRYLSAQKMFNVQVVFHFLSALERYAWDRLLNKRQREEFNDE